MDRGAAVWSVLLLVVLLWVVWQERWYRCREEVAWRSRPRGPRPWRPRTPKSCVQCGVEGYPAAEECGAVRPWREMKSPRGRKKQVDTEGHACWDGECVYYGITDAGVHALVGDGGHGKVERIQDLRCQACGKRVSERRGTALYGLKTASWRVSEVLLALAEGLDVGAAVRVFGHAEGTILRWRTRAGMHAERMHERFFHHLQLWHIQLDELKTRLREKGREVWVWVALDVKTKVIPSLTIGPRTQAMCNVLIHRMCWCLGAYRCSRATG
jgi:hypothetical protein